MPGTKSRAATPCYSREMYFATYQSIAKDERRPGLYKEFARDFFDLIIVDECHRGSAREESNWREILEYFQPAYQLGMTATPLREDNRDTYLYFGNPDLHLQPPARALTTAFSRPIASTASSRNGTPPAGGPARTTLTVTAAESRTKFTARRISSGRWRCSNAPNLSPGT